MKFLLNCTFAPQAPVPYALKNTNYRGFAGQHADTQKSDDLVEEYTE